MDAQTPTHLDLTLRSADGTPLRARHWPRPEPKGLIVIAHGLGEHGGAYQAVAEDLGRRLDVDVLAPDFRGHGRSHGRRGLVLRYEELLDDLDAALDWARAERPRLPLFLLGHSNGGQVALRAALSGRRLDGLILSNPALKLAMAVPRHALILGNFLRRYAPRVTLGSELDPKMLTRDPEAAAARKLDDLRHNRISPELYFGMVEGGPRVADMAAELRVPVLLMLGIADPVVDSAYSLALFDRFGSPDKTLKTYPDSLHEPLNDLDRHLVLDDLSAWLEPRLARAAPPGRPETDSGRSLLIPDSRFQIPDSRFQIVNS